MNVCRVLELDELLVCDRYGVTYGDSLWVPYPFSRKSLADLHEKWFVIVFLDGDHESVVRFELRVTTAPKG